MKISALALVVAATAALGFGADAHAQLSSKEKALLVDYLKRLGANTERDPKCDKSPSYSIPYNPVFWSPNAVLDAELSRGLELAYCDLNPLRCEALGMWVSIRPTGKGYGINCR